MSAQPVVAVSVRMPGELCQWLDRMRAEYEARTGHRISRDAWVRSQLQSLANIDARRRGSS